MTLRQQFDHWATTPPSRDSEGMAHALARAASQDDAESAILEALWVAYREGYRQCSADVSEAIRQDEKGP